jgi:glycine/D-amino acid oxidase-like deaminating enzyme
VRHDAHGWWLAEAGPPPPRPPLAGDVDADVVVVGGGYAGLWTAWHVLAAEPSARVVVLEAERCGFGPSGRNGGFVDALWESLPRLVERHGERSALALCHAAADSVRAIGRFCGAEGVDAWFAPVGHLVVSTGPSQNCRWDAAVTACARAGAGVEMVALDAEAVRARFDSPVVRGGALLPGSATVQPARLALGLAERLAGRGARIYEGARVRALRTGGARAPVAAETAGGRVRAGAAVVAVNAAAAAFGPLRDRFTVASSHIVLTEPVPAVLASAGWSGREAVSDARALLHYLRPTRDDRIAFGWAGGRMAYGARLRRRVEVDAAVAAEAARRLERFFPAAAGVRIEHAWGGPIDVSPDHLPQIGALPGDRAFFAAGFTGNGVGPTHLAGRVLAALALDRRDELTRLALVDPSPTRVPPEPLRWLGGTAIRAAFRRAEDREDAGRPVDPVTRWAAGLPARLGVHVGR